MLFEKGIVGEKVDFNLEESRRMFRLENFPFEYLVCLLKT